MGRTAQTASNWVRAWGPAPKTATTAAPGRARRSVATPDAAPVRMAVSDAPSITARGLPVAASRTTMTAWIRGRPRSALLPKSVTIFVPMRRAPGR